MNELLEEYELSPIEAKALVKRVEQFKEEQQSRARDNGQIVKQVVAFGEPAGKGIRDCKLVPVNLTMKHKLPVYVTTSEVIVQEEKLNC